MTFASEILELLRTWIEDDSIDDSFIIFINLAIREAEGMIDWPSLYGEKTVTPSAGIITAPPEMHKLLSIYGTETTDGLPNFKFSLRDSQPTNETGHVALYTAEPYLPIQSTYASFTCNTALDNVVIAEDDTGYTPANDIVGKRLVLYGYPDLYEVISVNASNITLSRKVPYLDTESIAFVEPEGTERYLLTDKSSTPFTGNVLVKYQRKHPSIANSGDLILINCPQTIALLALQNAMITDKYNVDAQRLNEALILAKNREIGGSTFNRKTNKFKDTMFSVHRNSARAW
jgi:hypothetical protein